MFTIKVTNKKTGQIQESDFPTMDECNAWVKKCSDSDSWGKAGEYDVIIIPSVIVIPSVSPRQIRMALLAGGVTEAMVDSVINGFPSPSKEEAMIAWKYSGSYERSIPIIASIGTALGLSSDQLDTLWLSAGTL